MKISRPFAHSSGLLGLAAIAVAAPLFLAAPAASARDFGGLAGRRVTFTRTPAYANGWGWGYPVNNTPSNSNGNRNTQQALTPSLPSGYIATLPADAAPVVVFGQTYYFSSGFYYQPTTYLGQQVYKPANP